MYSPHRQSDLAEASDPMCWVGLLRRKALPISSHTRGGEENRQHWTARWHRLVQSAQCGWCLPGPCGAYTRLRHAGPLLSSRAWVHSFVAYGWQQSLCSGSNTMPQWCGYGADWLLSFTPHPPHPAVVLVPPTPPPAILQCSHCPLTPPPALRPLSSLFTEVARALECCICQAAWMLQPSPLPPTPTPFYPLSQTPLTCVTCKSSSPPAFQVCNLFWPLQCMCCPAMRHRHNPGRSECVPSP
jgi:hypothetical protein